MASGNMRKRDLMTIALVGQPNSGKSTIFNAIAGLGVRTGNFPGTTVTYTETVVGYKGRKFRIVDLPGIYSFYTGDLAEKVTRDYLLHKNVDVVINVIDASVLSRSLEFTLELCEMQIPMVIALNMMDEAKRKGIQIDLKKLESILGIKAVETVAHRGLGIDHLFESVFENKRVPTLPQYSVRFESYLTELQKILGSRKNAILYLQGVDIVHRDMGLKALKESDIVKQTIEKEFGINVTLVLSNERHALAMAIFEKVAKVQHISSVGLRERVDRVLLHPIYGLIVMMFVFLGMLSVAFFVGNLLSEWIVAPMEDMAVYFVPQNGIEGAVIGGFWEGVVGGVGIVIPYMLPLLFLLGLLEDIGYISRAAYVLDRLFHYIGLHGKASGPFLLGYGCTVPAIMATRILEDPKDRIKAAILVPMIPCSARSVVILALIAGIFGPIPALAMYLFNIIAISVAGGILRRLMKTDSIGLIMEIPDLQIPSLRVIWKKTYHILYEFIVIAWPIIIVGSIIFGLLTYFGLENSMNNALEPLTVYLLGIPAVLGFTLIFGIFRKELALLLTLDAFALGHGAVNAITGYMTTAQIFTYVVFITFYIPCLSTIAVLYKEFKMRITVIAIVFNIVFALMVSVFVRGIFMIL